MAAETVFAEATTIVATATGGMEIVAIVDRAGKSGITPALFVPSSGDTQPVALMRPYAPLTRKVALTNNEIRATNIPPAMTGGITPKAFAFAGRSRASSGRSGEVSPGRSTGRD